MRFDHFDSNQDESLMSIQDLKESRIRKQKIENDKKARKYIFKINERYRKMRGDKNSNFF